MASLADVLHAIVDALPVPGNGSVQQTLHDQITSVLEEVAEDVIEDAVKK